MSQPSSALPIIASNLAHFVDLLRRTGMAVGPQDLLNAQEALTHIKLDHQQDFYWALHATLTKSHIDHNLFDQAFTLFWHHLAVQAQLSQVDLETDAPSVTVEKTPPTSQRLLDALVPQTPPTTPRHEEDIDATDTWSSAEIIRQRDFDQMSVTELNHARRAIARLPLSLPQRPSRRTHPSTQQHKIDLRATLRHAHRTPDIITLKWQSPRPRPTPLVVLCDISGSMSTYARMMLHLMHLLGTQKNIRLEGFLFGTRLHRITRQLKHRDIDAALAAIQTEVDDWDGGTKISTALRRFNIDWARRVLGQGATVLLITDGLDRDGPGELSQEMARLHRTSKRLIWLNPLLRYDRFEPKASGIRAMLPHVDVFQSIHNVKSMEDLLLALNTSDALRQSSKAMRSTA
ncbi:MAG: VWA domain-containing protein [Parvibaculaceae bacterium]|nr:VWA domain-containing protein [Parvibaculaceae bacterium]